MTVAHYDDRIRHALMPASPVRRSKTTFSYDWSADRVVHAPRSPAPTHGGILMEGTPVGRYRSARAAIYQAEFRDCVQLEVSRRPRYAVLQSVALDARANRIRFSDRIMRYSTLVIAAIGLIAPFSIFAALIACCVLLMFWGLAALFEYSVVGHSYLDPRGALLLVFIGAGNIVVGAIARI